MNLEKPEDILKDIPSVDEFRNDLIIKQYLDEERVQFAQRFRASFLDAIKNTEDEEFVFPISMNQETYELLCKSDKNSDEALDYIAAPVMKVLAEKGYYFHTSFRILKVLLRRETLQVL